MYRHDPYSSGREPYRSKCNTLAALVNLALAFVFLFVLYASYLWLMELWGLLHHMMRLFIESGNWGLVIVKGSCMCAVSCYVSVPASFHSYHFMKPLILDVIDPSRV